MIKSKSMWKTISEGRFFSKFKENKVFWRGLGGGMHTEAKVLFQPDIKRKEKKRMNISITL